MSRVGAIAGFALLCCGCDEMADQPRAPVYGQSSLFPNGAAMQPPPPGAVARGDAAWNAALTERPEMTAELLARGRDRYAIFCQPCHDPAGYGEGAVPAHGYPRPPSFHQARLRAARSSHLVEVITNGHGVMYGYADRVPPADRWAIAAYIRALQLSQAAPVDALSPHMRARFEAAHAP